MHVVINNRLLKIGVYFACPHQVLVRLVDQYFSVILQKAGHLTALLLILLSGRL